MKRTASTSAANSRSKLLQAAMIAILFASRAFAQSNSDIEKTVNRALPVLQRSAADFVSKRACVSCHHNFLPVLTFHLAQERGFAIDSEVLSAVEEKTFRAVLGP